MPLPHQYKSTRMQNADLVSQLTDFSIDKWIQACGKLGLEVFDGKGSHIAVYKAGTQVPSPEDLVDTMPRKILKCDIPSRMKKLIYHGKNGGGYVENDVWRALGFKDGQLSKDGEG